MSKTILLLLRDIAIALAIMLAILFFFRPTIVFEHSMENTLHPRDYVILSKQAYTFGDVKRGDIVVFKSEIEDTEHGGVKNLIKRVIALPGDTVEIKDDKVFLNGNEIQESYLKDGVTSGNIPETIIGEEEFFMMGDNRLVSKDSRDPEVGLIAANDISGKVIFRLFPLSSAGTLH